MKTQLIFRYSEIYDQSLAKLAGADFDRDSIKNAYAHAKQYSEYWAQHNDKIFDYFGGLGLTLSSFWMAYFIHPYKGLTAFSDPLTMFINPNFEVTTTTLVHELSHVFLTYYENYNFEQKLEKHIAEKFSAEDFSTQNHLMVNVITLYGLSYLFGRDKANLLVEEEKNYIGLKRAWEIIGQNKNILESPDPVEALLRI